MSRAEHDSRISGTPIQEVTSIAELSRKYVRARTEDYSDSRLASKLESLEHASLVTLPTEYSRISVEDVKQDRAHFVSIPELGYARHESRTAVLFGQLALERELKKPISELVAVKYTSTRLAVREFVATNAVRSRIADTHAFDPIGFIIDRSRPRAGTGYLSRYRHEVTTLDTVFWNESASAGQRLAGAALAGTWMAGLHNHGISHGDAEPKNIAYDSGDVPVYPDLETAHDLYDPMVDAHAKQLSDIEDFVRYQETGLTTKEWVEFADSYLDSLNSRSITVSDIREIYEKPLLPVVRFAPLNP